MNTFKKLGCGANCPTKTGFTDCEGAPILSNASLATCADLEKLDPDKPIQPTDYCPSVKLSCSGQYGYGFGPDDIKDPAATVEIEGCDGVAPVWIYPTALAGHNIEITDDAGVVIGYSANSSQCAGGSLVTISGTQATGKVIATVTIDGTPTDIRETITSITEVVFDEATRTLSITYKDENGNEETLDANIPAIDAVVHIAPAVITPPTKYPQYFNTIVTDANGNFWAFSIDGTPTLLNITETITTITDVLTYANKHEIFKYKNESGLIKSVFETVTSITGALTSGLKIGTFKNEDGTETDLYVPVSTAVSIAGQLASGNPIGTVTVNGTPTVLRETVTTMTGVQAAGKTIGLYTNESGTQSTIKETVTTLKSLTYTKATSVLTAVYTDETGTDITKTTTIKSQATAFINGTNPATATIFSLTTPPTVNDNTLKNNDDYVYVGTDGSYWFWNGTAYVTAPVPAATTEWNFGGTTVDAKGDKINKISRTGWVAIGKTGTPSMAIDTETSGTSQYLPVARFLGPGNGVAGNNTQLIYGVSQSYGNAADWRFYYAGNGNAKNRIDFTWSGVAAPVISYLVNGNVGINMGDPLSKLDVEGAIGFRGRLASSSTSQTSIDGTVIFTAPGSVYTLEAPSATTNKRRFIAVKNASTGTIYINGHIDNVAGVQLAIASGGAGIFHTEGTSWWRIADNSSRASARSNRGTDVTLDNLKFRLAASGNASLQVSTVSGTATLYGTSSSNFEANAAVSALAVTTTPVYIRPALNLPNAGDIQRFLFVTSDNRSYEVRLCIAPGYTSNTIHIERLV